MKGPRNITGLTHRFYFFRLWMHMMWVAFWEYRSISKFLFVVRKLLEMKRKFAGVKNYRKGVLSGGRFYWHINIPGYPSGNFDRHYRATLNKFLPLASTLNRVTVLYFGITRKCPLQCIHCYDWEKINSSDRLPGEELQKILARFQQEGLGQVLFLGGEPMMRFDELVEMITYADHSTEFWVSTSGYGMTANRALILKKAGLSGLAVSLDHFEEEKHNSCRGNIQAFEWAIKSTEHAVGAGLMTCWSVCVSNEFISWNNLLAYARFAASKKVNFIQIFEPMPVGRYKETEVDIRPEKIAILEDFFVRMNQDPTYADLPIVIYPGYHQRRTGCLAAGERSLYVDCDGYVHPCPFCRSSRELNLFQHSVPQLMESLKSEGCKFY